MERKITQGVPTKKRFPAHLAPIAVRPADGHLTTEPAIQIAPRAVLSESEVGRPSSTLICHSRYRRPAIGLAGSAGSFGSEGLHQTRRGLWLLPTTGQFQQKPQNGSGHP